jgi:TetR/AcrR family transcriptional regulator, transcriptional repressor for nem operon
MARPKEFERDEALQQAIGVFAEHGFEGTSTETLLDGMGISRQSLYDTFGDKRRLYLECLQRYNADSIGAHIRALNAPSSPIAGIEHYLEQAVKAALADPSPSCLGTSAVCEFGQSDSEVSRITDLSARPLLVALERRIAEAITAGEAPPDLSPREAAHFLLATLTGIKVAARGGASAKTLRGIAGMALRSLRPPA